MSKNDCSNSTVRKVTSVVSVLVNNYDDLENKPTLNGVDLTGNLTAGDVNLLSSQERDYTKATLADVKERGGYVPVLASDDGDVVKVSSEEFSETEVSTKDTLDEDVKVGAYQYVLIDK